MPNFKKNPSPAMKSGFKLRSGNSPLFKSMGSSPYKAEEGAKKTFQSVDDLKTRANKLGINIRDEDGNINMTEARKKVRAAEGRTGTVTNISGDVTKTDKKTGEKTKMTDAEKDKLVKRGKVYKSKEEADQAKKELERKREMGEYPFNKKDSPSKSKSYKKHNHERRNADGSTLVTMHDKDGKVIDEYNKKSPAKRTELDQDAVRAEKRKIGTRAKKSGADLKGVKTFSQAREKVRAAERKKATSDSISAVSAKLKARASKAGVKWNKSASMSEMRALVRKAEGK